MFNKSEPFKCHSTTSWLRDGLLFVNWGSNRGWGQLVFGYDKERNKLICDSEYMGKEAVTEILRQMVVDSVELSVVKVNGVDAAWEKKVRILSGDEASDIFAQVIEKKFGGRTFTKLHNELKAFEDRWEHDGKIYCVFSHETQNTTMDEEERWFDIDTFALPASDGKPKDEIKVITGFTRIEEWSWVAEPINKGK